MTRHCVPHPVRVAIGAAAVGVLCALPVEARVVGDTITLGSAVSFSGEHAAEGIHIRNGYQLAVDRINATEGVKVGGRKYKLKVIYYDDESAPARTAQLVQHLIERDRVGYLLGPASAASVREAAAVAEQHRIPMIAAHSAPRSLFSRGYEHLFSVPSAPDRYLVGAVALAAETAARNGRYPSETSAALVFADDPFSRDVRAGALEALDKYGIDIPVDETLTGEPPDMSAILTRVMALGPDLLLVSGHSPGARAAARQIAEMNVGVPMVAVTHCETARLVSRFAVAADDFLCAAQWSGTLAYRDSLFGAARDYDALFTATYAGYKTAPYQAAQASAAVLVWKDAFERAGSFDPGKVREALAATDLKTFYGDIRFSPEGENIAKPMVLRQIQNGALHVVAPARHASHPFNYPRLAD